MRTLPLLLPDATQPKWAKPEHLLNLFEWNGLGQRLEISQTPRFSATGRPAYALNLNNQYRVDRELAAKKAPGNPCVYDAFDDALWREIERQDGMLILDCAVEAMISREDIAQGLLAGIEKQRLDPARVCVLNCNLRSPVLFEQQFLSSLPRKPKLVGFDTCFWLLAGFNRMTAENEGALLARHQAVERSLGSLRPYKYVSFNGRLRPHRFYVVMWLLARGLFEHGRLSFLAYDSQVRPHDLDKLRRYLIRMGYPSVEETIGSFDALVERLPMSMDVSLEESQASAAYKRTLPWRSQAAQFYDEAYFSIVVDTEFQRSDNLFLTPIAFKSFMNFSPFVYVGSAGGLQRMRELGFKTFSPWIDESYDALDDPMERMSAALVQIQKLSAMPKPQLQEMYAAMWPALSHNFWNFHRDAPNRAESVLESELLAPMGLA